MNNHYYVEPGSHRTGTWSICTYVGGHKSTIAGGYRTRKAAKVVASLLAGHRGRVIVCNS